MSENNDEYVKKDLILKEIALGKPSFSWANQDLQQFLAKKWNQSDPSCLKVIGRLPPYDGRPYRFLEDLCHPETGARLSSPTAGGKPPTIFIQDSEIADFEAKWPNRKFVQVEVDISPIDVREKRKELFACTARRNTLEPLEHMPVEWRGLKNIESESASLVFSKVRQLITENLANEFSKAQVDLIGLRADIEKVASEKDALEKEREKVAGEVKAKSRHIMGLDKDFQQRRKELQEKFKYLEDFLRVKGERMVALDLVERSVLEKIFPLIKEVDQRQGHDFKKTLSGNFSNLADYIQSYLWRKGICYTRAQLRNFLALLRTNDLIVLAGDSGSGKTSLVKSVAAAIGGRCTIVPVKPNWTGSEDLLGYYNPIERRYHPSLFLMALLEAAREPDIPHFICLDEMNLARVEYYFADFLSLLETRNELPWIHLYNDDEERQAIIDNKIFLTLEEEARKRTGLSDDVSFSNMLVHDKTNNELRRLAGFQDADTLINHHAKIRRSIANLIEIPPKFQFPKNVWIIGAINVDETTHYLSPKILDRVHVVRFRSPLLMDWDHIERHQLRKFDLNMDLAVNVLASDIGVRSDYPKFDQSDAGIRQLVNLSKDYLDPLGVEFGLRAIRQSINYINKADSIKIEYAAALNNVVLHKILPKIVFDVEKISFNNKKKKELLLDFKSLLEEILSDVDEELVSESAVEALEELIVRAEHNNGIANFWIR